MFPGIIPPPFFNSLIATVYSYRAATLTGNDVTAAPQYMATELVDWVRVDRAGCDDCVADDNVVDAGAVSSEDEQQLCHHVLIELLAQSRVVQVSQSHSLQSFLLTTRSHCLDARGVEWDVNPLMHKVAEMVT